MADRIIVMNKAVVMQEGTPEEIYEHPENPFVADFIGSINFIDREKSQVYNLGNYERVAIRPEKIEIERTAGRESLRGKIADKMCIRDSCKAVQYVTANPARAVGLDQELGSVEIGKRADLLLVDAAEGKPAVKQVFVNGECIMECRYRVAD